MIWECRFDCNLAANDKRVPDPVGSGYYGSKRRTPNVEHRTPNYKATAGSLAGFVEAPVFLYYKKSEFVRRTSK